MTGGKVVLVGLVSGKPPVGTRLAYRLRWACHDSDRDLEGRIGVTAAEIVERHGVDAVHEHQPRIGTTEPDADRVARGIAGPVALGGPSMRRGGVSR